MKSTWQRHVLAATGYCELGMFDEAERTLEQRLMPRINIEKRSSARRVDLYMAMQKWDLVAEVARSLVDTNRRTPLGGLTWPTRRAVPKASTKRETISFAARKIASQ